MGAARWIPLALCVACVSCGGDGQEPQPQERVTREVARGLPTQQYALAEEVCPEGLGMPRREEDRTRRRGNRQLAALVAAYRDDPDALVRTSYTPADEPGIRHEDLTVRELAQTHLQTAEELADWTAGQPGGDCNRDVASRLRELLGTG